MRGMECEPQVTFPVEVCNFHLLCRILYIPCSFLEEFTHGFLFITVLQSVLDEKEICNADIPLQTP